MQHSLYTSSVAGKIANVFVVASMVLVSFAPLVTPSTAMAATDGTLSVLINGAPPSPFCIAGPITVSGSGVTGGQGGSWHLTIGWGDGTASSTDASGITTSGLGAGGSAFTYTSTHTLQTTSTGITVILYHSQPSGSDGQVIAVSQCVAAPTQGVVILAKHVVNDNQFTPGTATAANFTLTVNGTNFTGSETGATPGALLTAGTYPITETGPSGYDRTSTVCGDGHATTTSGSVTVVAGHNYICTVTNNDSAPTVGTLHIVKHVVNNNGGTATAGQWIMDVAASSSPNHFPGSESGTDVIVTPGAYSISESGGPSGYTASLSTDCSGTIAAGQTKNCTITNDDNPPLLTIIKEVVNAFRGNALSSAWTLFASGATSTIFGAGGASSGATFQAGSYTLSETGGPTNYSPSIGCTKNGGATTTASVISLLVGDHATCIFQNTEKRPGTLHVIKHVVNDNPEGYTGVAQASDFTLAVAGGNPSPASFSGSEGGTDVTIDAGASYSVSETGGPLSSYSMSQSGDCSGTMPEGGSLTCTVTNNDNPPTTGGLTVVKIVTNDNGGTKAVSDFPLHVTDSAQHASDVTSGQGGQFAGGTYTVSETGDTHYTATFSGDCNSDGTVTVVNGASKTCTITNNDIAPSLTLVKHVINDNGGTATASDWTLAAIGNTSSISGPGGATSGPTLQAGTYTLGESNGPSGYTASAWSCTNDIAVSESNQITLGIGQSTTCTITNDDQPGTLYVKKIVINDNGGTATAGDFSFKVNGGPAVQFNVSGQNDITVNAGTHTVTEVPVEGYGTSYDNCNNISVPNGGEATCTITNNDGQATLSIVKHVTGADGAFTFSLRGDSSTTTTTITTQGGTGTTTLSINSGIYSLVESLLQGWSFSGAQCVYDSQSVGTSIPNGESINVHPGNTVTCTFNNRASGADLSVVKSVDHTTANVGQTMVYTIVASNAGPAAATDAVVHDALPSGLTYVSDDSGGAYATSTGNWNIASLPSASSTALHITATVNGGTEGQTITNSARISLSGEGVSDYNSDNNSGSSSVTVNTPAPSTPPPSGGGGGGGGVVISGPLSIGYANSGGSTPSGAVLGAAVGPEDCSKYLTAYIRSGRKNDAAQVTRLQQFLNDFENNKLTVNGIYNAPTLAALNTFQAKYKGDILSPWGASAPTGYVYYTTQKKVNEIYCKFTKEFPLTKDQLAEIMRIKALGQSYTPSVLGTSTQKVKLQQKKK